MEKKERHALVERLEAFLKEITPFITV